MKDLNLHRIWGVWRGVHNKQYRVIGCSFIWIFVWRLLSNSNKLLLTLSLSGVPRNSSSQLHCPGTQILVLNYKLSPHLRRHISTELL